LQEFLVIDDDECDWFAFLEHRSFNGERYVTYFTTLRYYPNGLQPTPRRQTVILI